MVAGIAGFTVFALVLESLIHQAVIGKIIIREEMPVQYIIYGIFMAGIFEETARLIAYKILKRKYNGIATALSYGIGHGGIESVLLGGFSMVYAIVICIMINTGNIGLITGKMEGAALAAMNSQIETIMTSPAYVFLISGIERLYATGIQLSLSVIMFYAVFGSKKIWLYPLAIGIHAFIDIPAAAFQAGVLKSILPIEGLVLIFTILIIIFARHIHRLYGNNPEIQPGAGKDLSPEKTAGL